MGGFDSLTLAMDAEKLTPDSKVSVGGILCTKREIIFVCVAVGGALLLCTAVILLAVGVGVVNTSSESDNIIGIAECTDAGCLEVSAELRLLLNESVDACTDFYSYACSGLGNVSPSDLDAADLEMTVSAAMRKRNEEQLENLVAEPVVRDLDWASEKKMKNFHKTCLNTYGNTVNGTRRFIDQIVAPTGGWQVLGDFDEASYDITQAMKKVHVDFYQNSIFSARITPDPLNSRRNVIQVGLWAWEDMWAEPIVR